MRKMMMLLMLSALVLVAESCHVAREVMAEALVESVQDPKTGVQVFSRSYDAEPYGIQVGKIVKARKKAKRKKMKERIDTY